MAERANQTRAIHGISKEKHPHLSGTPPIYMTSSFAFESVEQGARIVRAECEGYMYTRLSNPTIDEWVKRVVAMEGGQAGCATSSGMSAISSVLMHLTHAGENFISSDMVYSGTFRFFKDVLPRYGIECRFCNLQNISNLERMIDNKTRAVFLESPANPLLRVYDLEKVVEVAHSMGVKVIFDNTFMSPALFQPISHGCDIVVHSATKYLAGNGSLIAGIIITKDRELAEQIQHTTVYNFGCVLSPVNAWLLIMNLQTLPLRMHAHSENAIKVAQFLEENGKVAWVNYPGLRSHPDSELCRKYFKQGYSGMIAFGLKGGANACVRLCERVQVITHQVSLGDAKSLIVHPYSIFFESVSDDQRAQMGITEDMLRLSVGLESAEDIISDLELALG